MLELVLNYYNMATLNEITYDLLQHIRANNSDDDDIDLRSIKYWIKNQRALWLKNELGKWKVTSRGIIQDLGTLSLESSGTLKRTTTDVPNFLFVRGEPRITRVGPVAITDKNYSIVHYNHSHFVHNGRFNSDIVSAFLYNDRIYLVGAVTSLTQVNVQGVFEDPLDVTGMTADSEYPIHDGFLPYVKTEILKLDVKQFIQLPVDKTNDGSNNLN